MRSRRLLPVLVGLASGLALAGAGACAGAKGGAGGTAAPRKQLTPKEIVQQASPAIVRIDVGDGAGTGFFVHPSGVLATNLHVIFGKREINITLHDGRTFPALQVVGLDPARDLALLKIEAGKPVPVLSLGDSAAMTAGDQVIAIGNPLGVFDYSVSSGLVSQVRAICTAAQVARHKQNVARYEELREKRVCWRQEDAELGLRCAEELTLIQISAPISQGSSGGPLFNLYGEVIGVTTAIISTGQNLNLAIPTNYLKPILGRPHAISMEEFAEKTLAARAATEAPVERKIPAHPLSLFHGCRVDEIHDMVQAISDAINIGAPLYNKGEIEACFKIYEGTAMKFERGGAASCKGIQAAFGDGLLRASALTSYKAKAWAMRDTFDGLLDAAQRWAKAGQPSTPPAPGKSGKSGK